MTNEKLRKSIECEIECFKKDNDLYYIEDRKYLELKVDSLIEEFKTIFKISNIEQIGCTSRIAETFADMYEIKYQLNIYFKNALFTKYNVVAIVNQKECRNLTIKK